MVLSSHQHCFISVNNYLILNFSFDKSLIFTLLKNKTKSSYKNVFDLLKEKIPLKICYNPCSLKKALKNACNVFQTMWKSLLVIFTTVKLSGEIVCP